MSKTRRYLVDLILAATFSAAWSALGVMEWATGSDEVARLRDELAIDINTCWRNAGR